MVLAQAIIFNHICLFNIATPIIFFYFILRLPISLSVNWVLSLSFLLGLSLDIFSDTQGMNALACTILGGLRKPLFSLYSPREDEVANIIPSIQSLGIGTYLKYSFTATLLYCFLILLIQAFQVEDIYLLILRTVASTLLSFILILGIDSIMTISSEKRL